jgi:putative FmdB family regulatory protein
MPTYLYLCDVLNEEFEEFHSMSEILEECPKCKEKNLPNHKPKRLINCVSKGVVELYGQDLIDKCKSDAKQIQKEAHKDEKKYSNLIGEANYQKLQQKMDQKKR